MVVHGESSISCRNSQHSFSLLLSIWCTIEFKKQENIDQMTLESCDWFACVLRYVFICHLSVSLFEPMAHPYSFFISISDYSSFLTITSQQ